MFLSAIAGIKLSRKLPVLVRDKWQLLIGIMVLFFCGHLIFAGLLITGFPFPGVLIGASVLLGGFFAFVVIALTKATAKNITDGEIRLKHTHKILKHKENKLLQAVTEQKRTEEKLHRASTLFLRDLFEIMDEVLANRDQYTFDHAFQVAEISKQIGIDMGLSGEELESLELGCLVHDIGKTAIPDDVLLKPSRFDYKDKDIIKYHPLIGAKLIARHIQDDRITDIILNHHERLDGSGYPNKIKGKDIPLFPRIVAVADTYEALVAKRPYKKPLSHDKAIAILEEEAKKGRLDADIVSRFIKISKNIKLETGKRVTAGFMKDVEMFRNRSYFREPLTDFYNYRYLLFLDDARVLKKKTLDFDLILIRFPELGSVQQEIGYSVADQVLDELGENVLNLTEKTGIRRDQYDRSVMIFRKGIDYLIYAECDEYHNLSHLVENIANLLKQAEKDWGLPSRLNAEHFKAGFPVERALRQLFTTAK